MHADRASTHLNAPNLRTRPHPSRAEAAADLPARHATAVRLHLTIFTLLDFLCIAICRAFLLFDGLCLLQGLHTAATVTSSTGAHAPDPHAAEHACWRRVEREARRGGGRRGEGVGMGDCCPGTGGGLDCGALGRVFVVAFWFAGRVWSILWTVGMGADGDVSCTGGDVRWGWLVVFVRGREGVVEGCGEGVEGELRVGR
jgi:hypothetical protein